MNSLSEHFVAPVLEKLLADGTIVEYEIDTMAIHTSAPGTFIIVYITPTPEGLDTVQGAVRDALKASPLTGDAFGSFVDDSGHRDGLYKTDANYK
jgi:predicted alternative tryptophan synthase beta-subunit